MGKLHKKILNEHSDIRFDSLVHAVVIFKFIYSTSVLKFNRKREYKECECEEHESFLNFTRIHTECISFYFFQSDPSTAFLRAARAGQLEKVLEYLESGVDINASNAVSHRSAGSREF